MKTAFCEGALVDATQLAQLGEEQLRRMREAGFQCSCGERAVFVQPSRHGRSACFRSKHRNECDHRSRDGEIDAPSTGVHSSELNLGESITIKLGLPQNTGGTHSALSCPGNSAPGTKDRVAKAASMRLSDIHRLLLNANLSESSRLVGGEKENAKIEAKRYFRHFATLGLNEKNTANAYFGDVSSFGGGQADDVTFVRIVHAELPHPPYVLIRGVGIHQEVSARFGLWADLAGGSVLVLGVLQNDRRGIPFIVPADIDHIHFLDKQQVNLIAK